MKTCQTSFARFASLAKVVRVVFLLAVAIATGGLSAGAGTPIIGTIIGGQAVAPLGPILQWAGGDASSMSASLKAPYVVGGFRSGPVRQLRSTAGLELTVEWLPTTKQARIARSAPVKDFVMVDCATSLTSVGLWTFSVEEVANTSSEDFESMFTTAASDFSEVGQDRANDAYGEACEAANGRALRLLQAPAAVQEQLSELRSALAGWEGAHYLMRSVFAGGGTLYGHMAARSRASREQLMTALTGLALGGDGVAPVPAGPTSASTIEDVKGRVTELLGRPLEELGSLSAPRYVAEAKAELVKATEGLAKVSHGLPQEWASRISVYAIAKLDGMEW